MKKMEEMMNDAKVLVGKMTLEEKAGLCSGLDFWHTKPIERLGLPSIMVSDGPHGLRKQSTAVDNLGINDSVPAVCFPPAVTTASSFDRNLMKEMGEALGDECLNYEVSVLLGPGANIKRNPLCGRNFEYISEDPFVAGETATALINGIQNKNIGVSMKHYLANSQEKARISSDSVIDERTLREIYMPAFEMAIKKEKPSTLMCSYNKVNGTYASDNKIYMTDIARDEWGFNGLIMTDWGAMNDRIKAVKAGLDLEMPGCNGETDEQIVVAVNNGELDEKLVDICATRITALILATKDNIKKDIDINSHNELARKIARESAVLLENDGILPLNKKTKVLIVGAFAKKPRYQGAGSSRINTIAVNSLIDELQRQKIDFEYCQGYDRDEVTINETLLNEAKNKAKDFDVVVCEVGLPDMCESEGFDRKHMNMPESHNKLISEIAKINPNIIAVLNMGSPVVIPWRNNVRAILNMYLGGQNVGGATYDLLFGDYSPSGKLAETFPLSYDDVPNKKWFAKDAKVVPYMESIYVGYRYYDKANKEVAYPFGYGLSYSKFEYSNLTVSREKVTVDITNVGKIKAKEIVQLYISAPKSKIFKSVRELKGYEKVELSPEETKTVEFILDDRSYSYWNVNIHNWHIESGEYVIEVGASSRDIRLSEKINIKGDDSIEVPDYHKIAPAYYDVSEGKIEISNQEFEALLGYKIPVIEICKPFNRNNTIGDVQSTFIGRILLKQINKRMKELYVNEKNSDMENMGKAMIIDLPLRNLVVFSNGLITSKMLDGLLDMMNGHFFKGLKKIK